MEDNKLEVMESGKVSKALLSLGIPTMVGMLVSALFSLVDGFFVGKLGKQPMAAVSVVYPLTYVITGVGLLLGGGGSVYLARLLGDKKYEEANRTGTTVIDTAIIVGIALVAIILIFMTPLLKLLGTLDGFMSYAEDYLLYFGIGLFFNLFNVTFNNLMTSEGATFYSMMAMLIGGIANVILDPIFIFAVDMGVAGAGLATMLANALTTCLYLYFILAHKGSVRYNFLEFKPSKHLYAEISKIGLPLMFFQCLYSVALAITDVLASDYGDAGIAAIGISNRIISLGLMAVLGFTKGYQSFVSFNYGAKHQERATEAKKLALIWTTVFCVVCSILWILFAKNFVNAFGTGDEEVLSVAVKALRFYSVSFVGLGYIMVYTTTFLAIGQVKFGGIVSLARQGLFLIVMLFVLEAIFGLNGIILAQPVADALTCALIFVLAKKVNVKEVFSKVATN